MVQKIGLDIGRGYVKGYTEYNNQPNECKFKSIVGLGRNIDTSKYENPIYIEFNDVEFFVGDLAEIEGDSPVHNLKDDKTTLVVKRLIASALEKLAISNRVKIMLGVPNKMFKKIERDKIQRAYKGKEFNVKNKLTGATKNITIEDIDIFREGDAALLWYTRNREQLSKPFGMVTIGFRTLELAYYNEDFIYNDKKSKTRELGNKNALEYVQRKLDDDLGIMRELFEIDSSDNYDNYKKIAYENLAERVDIEIENAWVNLDEMEIKMAGGTALNLENLTFDVIEDAQMATAKGLWYIAEEIM